MGREHSAQIEDAGEHLQNISDQASTRRVEILEWVIIFPIKFSIVLEFI
jgi:uncharacterized Rmd1/YagE family protein